MSQQFFSPLFSLRYHFTTERYEETSKKWKLETDMRKEGERGREM